MQPKFDQKKLKSLITILDTMEWSKKPSHATVPLMVLSNLNKGGSRQLSIDPY
jgi:hypothetical protein